MKRFVIILAAACIASAADAQDAVAAPDSPESGNQPRPRHVHMDADASCTVVHPGDTVHYTLTIENVFESKVVMADLQLRPEGHVRQDPLGGLPRPDYRNLGGGGTGARDAQDQKQYAFSFLVPAAILSGVYHGVGVFVTTNDEVATRADYRIGTTPHAREQIRNYCLNVMSTFGGTYKPLVTNFKPGPIDPKK